VCAAAKGGKGKAAAVAKTRTSPRTSAAAKAKPAPAKAKPAAAKETPTTRRTKAAAAKAKPGGPPVGETEAEGAAALMGLAQSLFLLSSQGATSPSASSPQSGKRTPTTAHDTHDARHDTTRHAWHDTYLRHNAGVKMEIDDQASSDLLALEQARLADEEAERLEAEGELLPPPLFPSALVTHTTAELSGLTKKTTGEAPAASSVPSTTRRADVSLFI
jgi:hypothetical protein